ncbi:choice-of-anchor D domain-containing protein [Bremerella volcania]|uniref:choice-of-anchor D domain-containing protein n=1 Tax=Bremerella volcania TaxID=2527984 RepID=UPI0013FD0089|nr:choice-of-anchor D domain-containing protein [Bremerella volcania]
MEVRKLLTADLLSQENNDTISSAQVASVISSTEFVIEGQIGNGVYGTADVDMFQVTLSAGETLSADIDSYVLDDGTYSSYGGYSHLRLFDSYGGEVADSYYYETNDPDSGYGGDPVLEYTSAYGGTYYLGVSSDGNDAYDSDYGGSGYGGSSFDYQLELNIGDGYGGAPEVDVYNDQYGGSSILDDYGSYAFGTTDLGSDLTRTFRVTNSGTDTLTFGKISTTSSFSVDSSFSSTSLAPGAYTTFTIRFDADSVGTFNGTISFSTNDSDENPFNFDLSGTVTSSDIDDTRGTAQLVSVTPGTQTQIDSTIGDGAYGTADVDMFQITLAPGETLSADIDSYVLDDGSYWSYGGYSHLRLFDSYGGEVADSYYYETNDPDSGYGGDPVLEFTSEYGGTYYLGVSSDGNDAYDSDYGGSGYGGSSFDYQLELNIDDGYGGAPEITVYDDSYGGSSILDDYGSYAFGTVDQYSPLTHTFQVTNDGTDTLNLGSISVPSGFSVYSSFGDSSLEPGQSTTFTIQLDADYGGSYSGQLSFSTNDSDENPFNFNLSGMVDEYGGTPEITVYDDSYGGSSLLDDYGSYSFGTTDQYSPVMHTFQVTNDGSGTLNLGSISVPSGFSVYSSFGDSSLEPGQSTTFTIQLDADYGGSYSGQLSFITNDSDENPFNFNLSGMVDEYGGYGGNPEITLYDDAYGGSSILDDYGSYAFGTTSVGSPITHTFQVTNDGDATLTLGSITLPIGFSVYSGFGTTSLSPGQSTTFQLRLVAANSGNYGGTISFATNDSDENPFDFAVSGVVDEYGGEPEITVYDDEYGGSSILDDYGSYAFGTTDQYSPLVHTFQVTNDGTDTLNLGNIYVPGGFSVYSTFGDSTLDSGQSTTFTIQLNADYSGTFSGNVSFSSNDSDESPFNFNISGTVDDYGGAGGSPEIIVFDDEYGGSVVLDDYGSYAFGTTVPGSPRTHTFQVTNSGNALLELGAIMVPSGFSVDSSFGDATLDPGQSTTFSIRLDADYGGSYSGQVSFPTNDDDESPFNFNLTGTVDEYGGAPEITVYDDEYGGVSIADGYGNYAFGTSNPSSPLMHTFQVTNDGTSVLNLGSITVPNGFSVYSSFGDTTLDPGQSTSFTIQFNADYGGTYSGQLSFSTNDSDENPFNFQISGTMDEYGGLPEIYLQETEYGGYYLGSEVADDYGSFNFGNVGQGSPQTQEFLVTNTGSGTLTLGTINLPSGFSLVQSFGDISLSSGESTYFTVRFNADYGGSYSGELSFNTNDADENPYNFTLSGNVVEDVEVGVYEVDYGGYNAYSGTEVLDDYGSFAFDPVGVGQPASQQFRVTNEGVGILSLGTLSVPDGFVVLESFDDTTLSSGQSTYFTVQLTATTAGTYTGEISFSTNDSDENPYNFAISGVVEEGYGGSSEIPDIDVYQSSYGGGSIDDGSGSYDFGTISLNSPQSVTFQVANAGDGVLELGTINVPAGFSVTSNFGDTTLDPGQSTSFTIQLNADYGGTYSGEVSFETNDPDEDPFNFSISGTVDEYGGYGGGPILPEVSIASVTSGREGLSDGLIRLRRTGDLQAPLTAQFFLAYDTSATYSSDYTLVATSFSDTTRLGTVLFAAGEQYAEITISVQDDAIYEGYEYLQVRVMDDGSGEYSPVGGLHLVGIRDNEDPPSAPALTGVALENDTGSSSTDKVTTDHTIVASFDKTWTTGYVLVEFDHDGDYSPESTLNYATPSGVVYEPTSGDPALADFEGLVSIRYRTRQFDDNDVEIIASPWRTFVYTAEADAATGPMRIESFELLRDTANPTDKYTANPIMTGRVVGDFGQATARIEFDHDNDGITDGFVDIATSGEIFEYDPRMTDPSLEDYVGSLSFKYRLTQIENGTETHEDWQSFSFQLTTPPTSSYSISDMDHDVGRGESLDSDDFQGYNHYGLVVTGKVNTGNEYGSYGGEGYYYDEYYYDDYYSGGGYGEASNEPGSGGGLESTGNLVSTYIGDPSNNSDTPPLPSGARVQIDIDEDGIADDEVSTDEQQQFEYRPTGLTTGWHSIRARALEWSTEYGMYLYGPWTTYWFEYEAAPSPAVTTLELREDTGYSDSDRVTADPTLTGQIADQIQQGQDVTLEIDWNYDDTPDDEFGVGSDGFFEYTPTSLQSGYRHLRVRSKTVDSVVGDTSYSSWRSLYFTYTPPSPIETTMSLLVDDGASDSDLISSLTTVTGSISANDGSSLSDRDVVVQFDLDQDGEVDAISQPQSDSQFLFDSSDMSPGSITISARAMWYDPYLDQDVSGPWETFTFTYELATATPPTLSNLGLAVDTGLDDADNITSNPTLIASVEVTGDVVADFVELDFDGDGTSDATSLLDSNGNLTYTPVDLAYGQHTVAARVIGYQYAQSTTITGPWSEFTFTYQESTASTAIVESLALLSDSGTEGDGLTENGTIIGNIADDASVANVTVQVDTNSDGVADATIFTNADGIFLYTPSSLDSGTQTFAFRAVEYDSQSGDHLVGAWESITFTAEDQTDAAPALFDIEFDAGEETSVPTLSGRITYQHSVDGRQIEIDTDGDGTADYFTTTDEFGRFEVALPNLPDGTTSLAVRSRAISPSSSTVLNGSWQSVTVNYTEVTYVAAGLSNIGLINDDGYSSTDKVTKDARIQGEVSRDAYQGNMTIEIDVDGDGVVDGTTLVKADRTWSYSPTIETTGNVTLSIRTKDYSPTGQLLRSDWEDFNFTLEQATSGTSSALRVVDFRLSYDSGASNSDLSTNSAWVEGNVEGYDGGSGYGGLLLEFDHDGDGSIDGSVTSYYGSFSYYPSGLDYGWIELRVRAVELDNDDNRLSTSTWETLGFVYDSNPDSTEAQALATAYASFLGSTSSGANTRDNDLADASDALKAAKGSADEDFDDAVDEAAEDRDTEIKDADEQYEQDVADAMDAYLVAIAAAGASYQTALSNFSGDTTSFDFDPMQWPTEPGRDSLVLPADGNQPAPPASVPTYSGPTYNLNADPTYRTQSAAANNNLNYAVYGAQATRIAQDRTVSQTYQDAVKTITDDYNEALKDAWEAYRDAIYADPSNAYDDLSSARQAYYDQRQSAYDTYYESRNTSYETLQNSIEPARQTLNDAVDAAHQNYRDAINDANEAFNDAVEDSTDCDVWYNARVERIQAEFDARTTLEKDVSAARNAYDEAVAPSVRQYNTEVADAYRDYSQAVSDSAFAFDEAVADYYEAERSKKINATVALEDARAEALKERDLALADAAKTRDEGYATNAFTEASTIETARANSWVAEAQAKRNALAAWSSATGTPWSAYQAALANINVTYYQNLAGAHLNREGAIATANQNQANAIAQATHTHSQALTQLKFEATSERVDAKEVYWDESSLKMRDQAVETAETRKSLRDDMATARNDRAHSSAEAGEAYSLAITDAYHTRTNDLVDARVLEIRESSCSTSNSYYYYYGYANYEIYVPPADGAGINHDFNVSMNNASYDLQEANINANQAWTDTTRDLWSDYRETLSQDQNDQAVEIAGDLKVYHETTALIDRDFAIDTTELEGDFDRTLAAINTAYTDAVAMADGTYYVAKAQFDGDQLVDNAGALRSFRIDAAATYDNIVTAWNSNVQTPWSALHENLGGVEVDWAIASGDAEVAYATALATANYNHTSSVATADYNYSTGAAQAYETEVNAIADARNDFASTVAEAKYQYALAKAGISLSSTQAASDRAQADRDDDGAQSASHSANTSAAETAYQIAMAAAWLEYRNSSSSAAATRSGEIGSASREYNRGDIDYETYDSRAQAAQDAYNDEMTTITETFDDAAHAAWDDLRTARADAIADQYKYRETDAAGDALDAQEDQNEAAEDSAAAERTLAAAVRGAKIDLAEALATIDVNYATTMANLQSSYDVSTATATANHDYAEAVAGADYQVDTYVAQRAREEDRVSARGYYEVSLYQVYAAIKQAAAGAIGSELSAFQSAVATADMNWADALRIARDLYEDAVSYAGYDHLQATLTANVAFVYEVNAAATNHASSIATANYNQSVGLAQADATLYVASVTAEAMHEEASINAQLDYESAVHLAEANAKTSAKDSAIAHAEDLGDAWRQYYLDSTDEWNELTWNGSSYYYDDYYYYGYGYGYYGYSYYSSYYYYGYSNYSGYVYSNYSNYYGWRSVSWYGGGWNYGAYGWGGWGRGYYWGHGYGWGGWYNSDNTAWDSLQDTLEGIDEAKNDANKAARLAYAEEVGDAQIDRAEALGDVEIALATARATAGVNYAAAINAVDTAYESAVASADSIQKTAIANAEKAMAIGLASADVDKVDDLESAKVSLRALERNANAAHAGAIATAEAVYHQDQSDARAQQLAAIAIATGSDQAIYEATYAEVYADWIDDTSIAYVNYATSRATADGQLAYELAIARKARKLADAVADEGYIQTAAEQARLRAINSQAALVTHQSAIVGLDNVRRSASSQVTGTYEIAVATADKAYAITGATAQKQYEIDELNEVEYDDRTKTRNETMADAALVKTTVLADAKLAWQNLDAQGRATYSSGEAAADKVLSDSLATLNYTYTVQLAAAAETREYAKADAAGAFWVNDTIARNNQRTAMASADVNYWNSQENARVTAHTSIDTELNIPWTDYLVVAAQTQRNWWLSVNNDYMNLATERNTAESDYALALANGYILREKTIATAEKNHANTNAAAQRDAAYTRALSVRDYVFALINPAGDYITTVAQGERDYAVAVSQAYRDYVYDEDDAARDTAIDNANSALAQIKQTEANQWYAAEASAQANKFYDFATADYESNLDQIAADVALANAKISAEQDYSLTEVAAYLQSITDWAELDAEYRQLEANSFATAVSNAATANPSPWISYDAAQYAARANQVTAVTGAEETRAIAQATTQAAAETAQINADAFWKSAQVIASSLYNSAAVSLDYGFAYVQSSAIASLGQTGVYRTDLPTITAPPNVGSEYTVWIGSASDYDITIPNAYSTNSWYGYGSYYHWNWGAWGYYGTSSWWWYDNPWYGSYWSYGYWYWSNYYTSVAQPQEQFSASFWNVGAEASEVESTWRSYDGYGRSDGGLDIPEEAPQWIVDLSQPTFALPVSNGTKNDAREVEEILRGLDDRLADLWAFQGRLARAPQQLRPIVDFVAEPIIAPVNGNAAAPHIHAQEGPKLGNNPASDMGFVHHADAEAAEAEIAAEFGAQILDRDIELQGRQKELIEKFQKLLNEGVELSNENLSAFGWGAIDGIKDGAWNGIFAMAPRLGWYLAEKSYDAAVEGWGWFVYATNDYHGYMDKQEVFDRSITLIKTAAWTEQQIETLKDLTNQFIDFVSEGGDELFTAIMSGDMDKLNEMLQSVDERARVVLDEALYWTSMIFTELGHAIVDMTPRDAGFITGLVLYEVFEYVAIETGLAFATAATGGTATPATGSATVAYTTAKAANLGRIANRLVKSAKFLEAANISKIVKAFDRVADIVKMLARYDMCFVAGTPVHTRYGVKPIEEIVPGDMVLTRAEGDPNAPTTYKPVVELFKTNPDTLFEIELNALGTGSSEKITTTGEHPFFERELLEFVPAKELSVGSQLVLADGQTAEVISITEIDNRTECQPTYNFSVADSHTYFVGDSAIWVHNKGGPCERATAYFVKTWQKTGDVVHAAKNARELLIRYAKVAKWDEATLARHLDDLDRLLIETFEKKDGWGPYLTALKGAKPAGMYEPHAHHILFKWGNGEAQRALVKEGQKLLREVGIDPIFGKEVLYWAPNKVKGQHSKDTLELLIIDLRKAKASGGTREDFIEVLEDHARIAAGRTKT